MELTQTRLRQSESIEQNLFGAPSSVRTDPINLLVIIVLWSSMVILVNPIGDFPLNDDWAYGRTVYTLIETSDFLPSGWTATNLLTQALWGALFCLPFGFSFTALRLSTLLLGLVGVLASYGLLREVDFNPRVALIGALLVAVNPLYFGLSNTFMNDIPFLGFALPAIYFFWRGLKRDSLRAIAIGTLFSGIAILARQVGVAIPLAFGCAYVIKKGFNLRNVAHGFLPALFGLGVQFTFQMWLEMTMRAPAKYGNQFKTLFWELYQGPGHVLSNFTMVTLFSLLYLGLFIFPFLLILFTGTLKTLSSRRRLTLLAMTTTFFVSLILLVVLKYGPLPLHGHVLDDLGIGPVILKNSALTQAPPLFWWLMTLIGAGGAALLLQYLFSGIWQSLSPEAPEKRGIVIFVLVFIAVYFLPIALLGISAFGFYDRYLIPLLPLALMIGAASNSRDLTLGPHSLALALAVVLLYGGFTVGITHDYLSWNRVRWQALQDLMADVPLTPRDIDGGFEFNGWYLYDEKYQYDPTFTKSWYWVDNDDYVVSFNPVTDYQEISRYRFSRWIPWGQGNILVSKRSP